MKGDPRHWSWGMRAAAWLIAAALAFWAALAKCMCFR